jgi:HrpA-like RNA helicase
MSPMLLVVSFTVPWVCPQTDIHDHDSSSNSLLPPLLSLDTISHLILDEVHERDVNTDFTLTLLRGLLVSKQCPHLRLILMSATASVDFFVNYFASDATRTTTLEIPGNTFAVQTNWLSDCERFSGMFLCEGAGKGQAGNAVPFIDDGVASVTDGPTLSPRAPQKIDNKLILAIIRKIIDQQQTNGDLEVPPLSSSTEQKYRETGSILVFLPGKAEIEALAKCLYSDRSSTIGNRRLCRILKLYSSMPRHEQQNVFLPVLTGTVKIVLATNVAE